jgi:hypothetical protein
MAQDAFVLPGAGSVPDPKQDPEQDRAGQQSRRNLWALLVSLTLLAALIGGAIVLVAPWASAAGGCGGG